MRFVEKKNVYENIVEELISLIEGGVLRCGDKLPSVRAYAVDKRVNPNTVAKAYSVLEERGYVRIELKKGGYVCYGEGVRFDGDRESVRRQIEGIRSKGITLEELNNVIAEVYAEKGGKRDD